MTGGLSGRLTRRVTFVVGKGGVGKTTVAGALALSLADDGISTHLLSTDPAHSVRDLFGEAGDEAPGSSRCTDQLILEELDAAAVAEARLRAMAPGLREIIDRGTYLDTEDADALLDVSLPGLDEIGAALRIAGLKETRLVVDTAPTGHLLRLLETPDVVEGWLDVFRAMAGKADAVASALVRREVRLSGETELERLEEAMATFRETVREADFVVVTGGGVAVEAETARLKASLESRRLRVAVTISPRGERTDADFTFPRRSGLEGCEALRSWWREGVQSSGMAVSDASGRTGASRPPRDGEVDRELAERLDRELVIFAGKGGVGKSTCAAAAAIRLAERGPVLLLGSDPAGSLGDIMGGSTVPGLEVRELDADRELERFREMYGREVEVAFEALGLERAARMDRAVVESLWRLAPPGVDELMAITRLAGGVESGTRVVVDTAPTGHFLRLMAMPELANDWVRRMLRILLKYRSVGELDAPADHLLRFAKRIRALRERLVDQDRTALVLVTLDEPMVRAETERLARRVRSLGLPLTAILVNRATGALEPAGAGAPTWRAPDVVEPRGGQALLEFTRAWERLT